MRILVVSDTHLSQRAPEAQSNWDAVVAHVAADSCDLVLHLGDLSLNGASQAEDIAYASTQLERLSKPYRVIPGNHDLGDNPYPGSPPKHSISDERRQRWLNHLGPDHWSIQQDGWQLLAINAQLFGSNLEAEQAQWRWLEQQLTAAAPTDRIALISHKPWQASAAELAAAPPYRFVPNAARQRMAALLGTRKPALILSGHVHQHRTLTLDETHHAWAPTTWALLPDEIQPTLGTKRCGALHLELTALSPPQPELIEPEGLQQFTLLKDIASPYESH